MRTNKFYFFGLVHIFSFCLVFADENPMDSNSFDQDLSMISQFEELDNLSESDDLSTAKLDGKFGNVNRHNKNSKSPPNILFILVDELRFPPEYESEELKEWKRQNLVFLNKLASQGTVFHNHYINSSACAPSRATLHTGQYPHVHGVTQTDGIAKDPLDVHWLAPFTVPTIGNYLREAGYKTFLKGKWHVTDASIRLEDGEYLTTYNDKGFPIPEYYQFYLEKNVLHDFGYDGWIGPEPHGTNPLDSASSLPPGYIGRDVKFTQQVVETLDELEQQNKPWLLVASFLDPHDITLYGLLTQLSQLSGQPWDFTIDPTLPAQLFKPEFQLSLNESLATKPPAQASYRDLYPAAVQPILDIDRYQRYYYTIQKRVDQQLLEVWKKLKSSSMYKNTIIVLTADHGDLLASHGGMFQKWYQAYQETIHVPFIVSSPLFGNKHQDVFDLTSHIDILPTFLNFANADVDSLREKLSKKFSIVLPPSGRSLYPFIKNPNKDRRIIPVYFYTEDNPFEGPNQVNALCQPFPDVVQPSSVEAVVAFVGDELWKLTQYFSTESCQDVPGITNELYNISQDPMELNNLYGNPLYLGIQQELTDVLNRKRVHYRIAQVDNVSN